MHARTHNELVYLPRTFGNSSGSAVKDSDWAIRILKFMDVSNCIIISLAAAKHSLD